MMGYGILYPYLQRFSENFKFFRCIFLPQRSIILDLFLFSVNDKKRYLDAILVAISRSFGSYGEQGVLGVDMFL